MSASHSKSEGRDKMRNMLLALTLGLPLVGICGSTQAAMPKADKPSIGQLAEPVVCHGNRRNYRDFNRCWRVNRAARYCSRICNG
jgi:hypothetical protein